MEVDDLDNLIADSLAGVHTALENDRKVPQQQTAADTAVSSATEAVRELQQGHGRSNGEAAPPNEEFFCSLVKSFENESFQKAMADALQITEPGSEKDAAVATSEVASKSTTDAGGEAGVEDFLANFMKTFEKAVGSEENFENQVTSMMTSMLSPDLIMAPLQQIANALEPWLKSQTSLPSSEREQYEKQLRLYHQIINVYKGSENPLPSDAQLEVQRLLSELHTLGQPPDEVMKQITPKEAEDGADSFEDFVKSMGLADNLGSAEQDLLKKLTDDPDELTKVMKDMAGKLDSDSPDEACKQQ